MIKLALASLLVAHTMFQVPYTLEVIAGTLGLFSLIYYYTTFGLFTGLSQAQLLTSKDHMRDATASTLVHVVSTIVLFYSQYQLLAMFIMPWVGLAVCTLVFSLLVYFEIIEIRENDE